MTEGWKCPSCGRCYNPVMMQCTLCPTEETKDVAQPSTSESTTWRNCGIHPTAWFYGANCPQCIFWGVTSS